MTQHLIIQPFVSCEKIYVAPVEENIVIIEYFRLFVHPLVDPIDARKTRGAWRCSDVKEKRNAPRGVVS